MWLPKASLAGLFVLTAAAVPQTPEWDHAARVEIALSNFKFTPATITLKHGQPYLLHLVNRAEGGHDFVAKKFFAAATVAPSDKASVAKGEVELDGGDAADIRLIAPAPGSYEVHCSHFMHSTFGMKGTIVVD